MLFWGVEEEGGLRHERYPWMNEYPSFSKTGNCVCFGNGTKNKGVWIQVHTAVNILGSW